MTVKLSDIHSKILNKVNLLPLLKNIFIKNHSVEKKQLSKLVTDIFYKNGFSYFNTLLKKTAISNMFDNSEQDFKVATNNNQLIINYQSSENQQTEINFNLKDLKAKNFTIAQFKYNILNKYTKLPSKTEISTLFKDSYFLINTWNQESNKWEIINSFDIKDEEMLNYLTIERVGEILTITIKNKYSEYLNIEPNMFQTKPFEKEHFQKIITSNSSTIFFELRPNQPPKIKSFKDIQQALWSYFKSTNYRYLKFNAQKAINEPYHYKASSSLSNKNNHILNIDIEGRDSETIIENEWKFIMEKYTKAKYNTDDIVEKLIFQYYLIDPNDNTKSITEEFSIPLASLLPTHFNYQRLLENINLNNILKSFNNQNLNLEALIIEEIKRVFTQNLYWYQDSNKQYAISLASTNAVTIDYSKDQTTFTITALHMSPFDVKTSQIIQKIDLNEMWDLLHKYMRTWFWANNYNNKLSGKLIKEYIYFFLKENKFILFNQITKKWVQFEDNIEKQSDQQIKIELFWKSNNEQIELNKIWTWHWTGAPAIDGWNLATSSIYFKIYYYDLDENNKLITNIIIFDSIILRGLIDKMLFGATDYKKGSHGPMQWKNEVLKD